MRSVFLVLLLAISSRPALADTLSKELGYFVGGSGSPSMPPVLERADAFSGNMVMQTLFILASLLLIPIVAAATNGALRLLRSPAPSASVFDLHLHRKKRQARGRVA